MQIRFVRSKKVETRGLEVRKRRALNAEEVGKLLEVAGPRKSAYLMALFTGLRRNELKQLEWSEFHLDGPEPFLTVRSSITKNKREATIRLHKQLAAELRAIQPSRNLAETKLFDGNRFPGTWVFKSDLKRAGIPYADAQNRKADFHALRYTFATNLTKAGVSPREAMELMRHSDLRLTMKTYTDAGQLCTGEALAKLPSFTVTPTGRAVISRLPLKTDAQIDAQTPDSDGRSLAWSGTQIPVGFDTEIPENEGASHDLALAGTARHSGRNGSSGRIRSFFPVVYRERMPAFPSEGKASLPPSCHYSCTTQTEQSAGNFAGSLHRWHQRQRHQTPSVPEVVRCLGGPQHRTTPKR